MLFVTILEAIVAGLLIGFGGCAYLATPIPYLGALLFATGLLCICLTKQSLYTGKICFAQKDNWYYLPTILVFNLITAYGFGWAVRYMKPDFASKAFDMCATKLGEGWMVIPLGICCNILIYFAVQAMNKEKSAIGLIMCVMVFILCGFEHCVANAFYFGASGIIGLPVLSYLGLNVLGNTIGGLLCLLIGRIQLAVLKSLLPSQLKALLPF